MFHKIRSPSRLAKVFLVLSAVLAGMYSVVYVMNVSEALGMDPTSYNCTNDGMMMQICADPYGSSIIWSFIDVVSVGWPVLIAWLIAGSMLLDPKDSRNRAKRSSS